MSPFTKCMLLMLLGAMLAPLTASAAQKHIMVYYPSWQRGIVEPDELPWNSITHIAAGPVVPKDNGSLDLKFGTTERRGKRWMREIAETAKDEGVTPILFVGGASSVNKWHGAASSENRKRFARELVKAADDLGYEGIDLDWEPLRQSDYITVAALAAEIKRLDPSLELTLPVGYVNSGTSIPAQFSIAARYFDHINIMTYDMAGAWPGWESWHHSALRGATPTTPSSIETVVRSYLAAGIARSKLGIGVPQYGYCWSGVTGPRQAIDEGERPVPLSYIAIMEDYYRRSARKWDSEAATPYLSFRRPTGEKDCTFISYIDAQAARERAAFVNKEGLGGVIVWSASQAYMPEESDKWPIVDALADAL